MTSITGKQQLRAGGASCSIQCLCHWHHQSRRDVITLQLLTKGHGYAGHLLGTGLSVLHKPCWRT